jgi:hypothetical protein
MPFPHSAISTFEQCPRKYAFQYVERFRIETERIEAPLGKCVPESLLAFKSLFIFIIILHYKFY